MQWASWRRWTIIVSVGELAGFTFPAVAGAMTTTWGSSTAVAVTALVAAGAVEGWCLGFAQAWALRARLASLPRARFATATAAAAVLAYAVAMLTPLAAQRLATAQFVVFAVAGGLVLLASIGTAQWLVFRGVGVHAPWWIATTAGAWAAGLLVFMLIASPLWRPGQPLWLTIGIGVVAGALMAVSVAALTGLAAMRLPRTPVDLNVTWPTR